LGGKELVCENRGGPVVRRGPWQKNFKEMVCVHELREEMRSRWNEKGGDYDQSGAHGVHNPEEREQWLRLLKERPKGQKILDVGTGTGFVALLAAELGHEVTGLDWSETMLRQAEAKAEAKNLTVHFTQGSTETLPFQANSFQAVTARHVLWTLTDPAQAFAEWYRVLQPGGRVWADYSPRREMGNSHHYSDDVEKRLPLNQKIAPETIVGLFQAAGFRNTAMQKREHKGHHKTTYLFSGVK
jgi:ubiquinone/menaquinone biosynthesis C-methylase UbiE